MSRVPSKQNLSRELYSYFILIMPHFHLEKKNLYSIQHRELYSVLCGDRNGKEIQKRGDMEKAMAPPSSTLAWKIPWMEEPGRLQSMGSLSRKRLSDFTLTFHFHSLEKEMAAHSSVLAWRIPWMEKPSRLESTGSQRVGHD